MVYSYAVEIPKERFEAIGRLEEYLTSLNAPARETWGRLPSQQQAMRRAAELGGPGKG